MNFLFNLMLIQCMGKVVENGFSGKPLLSGFISNPQQNQYPQYTKDQYLRRLSVWAFGIYDISDTKWKDVNLIELWNNKHGQWMWLNPKDNEDINLEKIGNLWVSLGYPT